MGRGPQPVATVQPQDAMMNCAAIYAEIQGNNHRIEELGREKGWKTAQNVAAGVGGLVVPVLWFGMDWQGAAGTEARALQDRQSYLGALAVQKHCGGGSVEALGAGYGAGLSERPQARAEDSMFPRGHLHRKTQDSRRKKVCRATMAICERPK